MTTADSGTADTYSRSVRSCSSSITSGTYLNPSGGCAVTRSRAAIGGPVAPRTRSRCAGIIARDPVKRLVVLILVLLALAPILVIAERKAGFIETMPTAKLKELFPKAVAFTPRGERDPIHFTAYAADPAKN